MAQQIQFRRGTAAAWTAANPTLALGELGYETDTKKFKIGDGVTAWNSLAYVSVDGTFASLTTTLTNKRITARVLSEAFSATPTINTDSYDEYHATAMSGAITSMTSNLSGTPVTGDILVCEFTDNGTARAISWGSSFESSTVALPTTTVISNLLTVTLKWNAATSKWRCVGVA